MGNLSIFVEKIEGEIVQNIVEKNMEEIARKISWGKMC